MERILILTSLVLVTTTSAIIAEPPPSYGVPQGFSNNLIRSQDVMGLQSFRNSLSGNNRDLRGNDPGSIGDDIPGPKIFRHISLFVAPQDPSEQQQRVRTIQPQQAPDKHYQIIFIKAPSHSNSQQTEVVLPSQPEQKTLVYVLLKNPEANSNNVRIRGPSPTKPPAPEVFFIKYKDGNGAAGAGAINGQIQGSSGLSGGFNSAVPSRNSISSGFSTSYGAP